ncbi:DUF2971 domain-containing protein [Sneathiella sp.]|uniref:DUF2971 domain-containing protein n=1 Tax=Sneathiella sp. TaxID=1964365 RepID=UPI0025F4761E|nr:DUF2971 domain-containing protein [Sneathiella sp.]
MSKEWQHPLLWSHYAESHRGMCLGFDVIDDGTFSKVRYLSRRENLKDFGYTSMNEFTETDMKKLLFSKFNVWSYESEYRSFCTLEENEEDSNLYFCPFSMHMKLSEIIIGERSNVTRDQVANALGNYGKDILAFKARCAFRDFRIVRNQNKSAWK